MGWGNYLLPAARLTGAALEGKAAGEAQKQKSLIDQIQTVIRLKREEEAGQDRQSERVLHDAQLDHVRAQTDRLRNPPPPKSARESMTDNDAFDMEQSMVDAGVDPDHAKAAVIQFRHGNKGPASTLLKPPRPASPPRTSTRDPNTSASVATGKAMTENTGALRATEKAMPQFNPDSFSPRADSASVVERRGSLLKRMAGLSVRGDSLRRSFDKQSSAIGSGARADGSVDNSDVRAQVDDAQRKLDAILGNTAAPLAVKAKAQEAFKRRIEALRAGQR